MFDIGMSELVLIGIVALIVVGPKDLPGLFHTLGRFTARARQLGREFSRAMNDAAKESGVDDVAKGLNSVANPKKFGLDRLNEAADRFDKWDPSKGGKPPEHGRVTREADPEREADMKKIREATEKAGRDKLEREAAAKAEAEAAEAVADTEAKPEATKAPAKAKTSAKKAPAKTTKADASKTASKTTSKTTKSSTAKSAGAKSGGSASTSKSGTAKSSGKKSAASTSTSTTSQGKTAKPAARKTSSGAKTKTGSGASKSKKASTE